MSYLNDICQCGHAAYAHRDGRRHCDARIDADQLCLCGEFTAVQGALANTAQPSMYPDAAERRTYALLQAAATLRSVCATGGYSGGAFSPQLIWSEEGAVVEAERLLAIIERRLKEGN